MSIFPALLLDGGTAMDEKRKTEKDRQEEAGPFGPQEQYTRRGAYEKGKACQRIGKDKYEKECAQIAKQEITDLVLNKVVLLKNVGTEKYGRILADVYIDQIHLNDYLLKKRLAVSYDGGTKKCPKNWMDYHLKGEL